MTAAPTPFNIKPLIREEELSAVVDPLVDALSELVLSAVTADFSDFQSRSANIANRTNNLVNVARNVGTQSADPEVQLSIAESIRQLADSIESLVAAFTALIRSHHQQQQQDAQNSQAFKQLQSLQQRQHHHQKTSGLANGGGQQSAEQQRQLEFAQAAKLVGDSINRLVSATDDSSQRRILDALVLAENGVAALARAKQSSTGDKLQSECQACMAGTVRLVKTCYAAAGASANPEKCDLLRQCADRLKLEAAFMISAAKLAKDRPAPHYEQDYQAKAASVAELFAEVRRAAAMGAVRLGHLDSVYDGLRRLVDKAMELESAAAALVRAAVPPASDEQFVESAKSVANKALELAVEVDGIVNQEKNPLRRAELQRRGEAVRELAGQLIRDAKQVRQLLPTADSVRTMRDTQRKLSDAIQSLLGLSQAPPSTDEEIAAALRQQLGNGLGDALAATRRVVASARGGAALVPDATALATAAQQLAGDLDALLEATADAARRAQLEAAAAAMRPRAAAVIASAKRVAGQPNDRSQMQALAQAALGLAGFLSDLQESLRPPEEPLNEEQWLQRLQQQLATTRAAAARVTASGREALAPADVVTDCALLQQTARQLSAGLVSFADEAATDPKGNLATSLKAAAPPVDERSAALVEAAMAVLGSDDGNQARQQLDKAGERLEQQLASIEATIARRGRPAVVATVRRPTAPSPETASVMAAANKLVSELEQMIAQTSDGAERQRLIEQRDAIRAKIAVTARASASAGPVTGLQDLASAAEELAAAVAGLRLTMADAAAAPPPPRAPAALTRDEEQLVAAAEQEADSALALADEIGLLPPSANTDAAAVREAIAAVKAAAAGVKQAAAALRAAPSPEAHESLRSAQHTMRTALAGLVACSRPPAAADEMAAALAQQASAADALGSSATINELGRRLAQQLATAFANIASMSAQELIAAAKTLTEASTRMSMMLRELAAVPGQDPLFKEKLLQASRIVKDGGTQLKILATVCAAGGNDSSSVAEQAKVFQRTVTQVVQEVESESLRTRYRTAIKNTAVLDKICAIFKKQRGAD